MLTSGVRRAVHATAWAGFVLSITCILGGAAHAALCANGTVADAASNKTDLNTATQVALGTLPISSCSSLDIDDDGRLDVVEVIDGVALSLGAPITANGDGDASGIFSPVNIDVGTAWGSAGELVTFDVKLNDPPVSLVAGAQIDINFSSTTPIPPHINPAYSGKPYCDVNPAINKGNSAFAFTGPNSIRAIIVSFTNLNLIPDGATLFTCHVQIASGTPVGTYPLACSNAQSSTAGGLGLPTSCTPGAVVVIPPTVIDHYKCYQGTDLKTPKFVKQNVTTTDQLTTADPITTLGLKFICTPVDQNGAGIQNPSAHLACYKIKANPLATQPKVLGSTQFQATQFLLKKPELLCVPATKTVLP